MSPRKNSRHSFTSAIFDSQGRLHLSERERFAFRDLSDNQRHVVVRGDTLFNLAGRYFPDFERPSGLWWIIADFQPTPILDPTLKLKIGSELVIPSDETLRDEILSETRRSEAAP